MTGRNGAGVYPWTRKEVNVNRPHKAMNGRSVPVLWRLMRFCC